MNMPILFTAFAAIWILIVTWVVHKRFSVKAGFWFFIIASAWSLYFSIIGMSGILIRFPTKPILLSVLIPILLFSFLFARSRIAKDLAEKISMTLLIGLQSFRIVVEIFLHQFYLKQLIPIDMTFLGRNFDILTGFSALLMALLVSRFQISKKWILAWNIVGLVLLLNVVITGILSAPGPLQRLNFATPNLAITQFPYTLLPGLFVTSAIFLHILTFKKLRLDIAK